MLVFKHAEALNFSNKPCLLVVRARDVTHIM